MTLGECGKTEYRGIPRLANFFSIVGSLGDIFRDLSHGKSLLAVLEYLHLFYFTFERLLPLIRPAPIQRRIPKAS